MTSARSSGTAQKGLSITSLAISLYLYFLYQSTESLFVGLSSVALLAVGLHLSIKNFRLLKPFRPIAPFIVIGTTGSLVLVSFGLGTYMANTYYANLLAQASARLTAFLFTAGGVDVQVSNGNVLSFSDGRALSIGPLCSGAYSTVLFLLLSVVMVADVGRSAPKKRLIVAVILGVVGANLANVLRITFLASVMYLFGLGALDVVHQFAGYAVFLGFMAIFWVASLRWMARAEALPV
jgi:exosortase/archaeosortase family protein